MDKIKVLTHIGLSKEEAIIYDSILNKPNQSISDISRNTGIHRPMIYKLLPILQENGLISQIIKGKRKLFSAESPENLNNLFKKQSYNFKILLERFKKSYNRNEEKKTTLKTIEGKNFSKFVFEDIGNSLPDNGIYYRYSSKKKIEKKDKLPGYKKLRDKKNIQRLIITSNKLLKSKPKRIDHEVVSIPKDFDIFDDNISKVIYNDKIGIIDYNNKTSFIIENPKLANFEKKIFKLLFKKLRKIGTSL